MKPAQLNALLRNEHIVELLLERYICTSDFKPLSDEQLLPAIITILRRDISLDLLQLVRGLTSEE